MKLGIKGQVVIPKDLRDELGIRPNDRIEFDKLNDNIITIKKVQEKDPIKIFSEIKKQIGKKFTVKEYKKIDWSKFYDEEMEEGFKK